MKQFTKMGIGLAAVAVLAAPSMASAHSTASVASVRAHVRNADQALAMVADRVKANDDAAAAIAMVQTRRQTQAATRESARILGRSQQAKALRLVAKQRNANVVVLSALVDDVTGSSQVGMATALNDNISGRGTALAQLTLLASTLPAAAQVGIAQAISAISGSTVPVANITTAINSGQIAPAALAQLQQALALAGSAMFTGVSQLQQIVGMLPGPAQGPVNMAIATVTGTLQSIFGNGGPAGAMPANLPIPCGLPIPAFLPFAKSC